MAGKVGNPYHDAKGLFTSSSSAQGRQSVDLEAARRRMVERQNKQRADAEYYKRHGETPKEFKLRQQRRTAEEEGALARKSRPMSAGQKANREKLNNFLDKYNAASPADKLKMSKGPSYGKKGR